MNETYDAHDPGFLFSRSLDETLPPDLRAKLDGHLQQDPTARSVAARMASLHAHFVQWAKSHDASWDDGFTEQVLARIAEQAPGVKPEEPDKWDQMLARWGRETPVIDVEAFVTDVMIHVKRLQGADPVSVSTLKARRERTGKWMLRLGTPLAAAAALALAVIGYWNRNDAPKESNIVVLGPRVEAGMASVPRVRIQFDRTPPHADRVTRETGDIGYAWAGYAPEETDSAQSPPM